MEFTFLGNTYFYESDGFEVLEVTDEDGNMIEDSAVYEEATDLCRDEMMSRSDMLADMLKDGDLEGC